MFSPAPPHSTRRTRGRVHGGNAVATVEELRDLVDAHTRPERSVPVHQNLRTAFPHGLQPGRTYCITGSRTVALALLSEPTRTGSWCAALGLPDIGLEAAADWGVDLERLVLVPQVPAVEWTACIADLIEVCSVILTCPPPRLTTGELSRLTGRLRHRGAVVLCTGGWPGQSTVIRARTTGWVGIGNGHGHLLRQHLALEITDRHRARTVDLTIEPPARNSHAQ